MFTCVVFLSYKVQLNMKGVLVKEERSGRKKRDAKGKTVEEEGKEQRSR